MTQKQIHQIARESKKCVGGVHLFVWADGSTHLDFNYDYARGTDDGGWEYSLLRIEYPMTIREVVEQIEIKQSHKAHA